MKCSSIVIVTLAVALLCGHAAHGAEGVFSVRDFGAVGDGIADDTAAFAAALEKAKSGPRGSSVIAPAGQYRLTRTISIEKTLLKGLDAGGWPSDAAPMPTIIVDFTDGPCILAREAASIHGLNFEYDHKDQEARKFGPTITLAGNGISVTNLRINQPYEGIMADGVTNIGRLNIENVFIVSARQCGVYVTNTYDIPTLRNIEVWNCRDLTNMLEYCQQNCVAFKLGKNDEIRIDNCFAFKCRTGYLFINDTQGSTWGGMTGSSADLCIEGVVVESAESLRISGGCLWTHHGAVKVHGPARIVTINGVDMKANGDPAFIVRGGSNITVTGCSFSKSGSSWPSVPAVRLESGSSVVVSNCIFDPNGPGIVIGEGMDNFSIAGNVFQPAPFESISDASRPEARKAIANNLVNPATGD